MYNLMWSLIVPMQHLLLNHGCLFIVVSRVGVSMPTREPTHPPKPPGPTRKPTNSTPVTVGDGSPSPKTDLGGSDGGFSSSKPDIPDLTDETDERRPEIRSDSLVFR